MIRHNNLLYIYDHTFNSNISHSNLGERVVYVPAEGTALLLPVGSREDVHVVGGQGRADDRNYQTHHLKGDHHAQMDQTGYVHVLAGFLE